MLYAAVNFSDLIDTLIGLLGSRGGQNSVFVNEKNSFPCSSSGATCDNRVGHTHALPEHVWPGSQKLKP